MSINPSIYISVHPHACLSVSLFDWRFSFLNVRFHSLMLSYRSLAFMLLNNCFLKYKLTIPSYLAFLRCSFIVKAYIIFSSFIRVTDAIVIRVQPTRGGGMIREAFAEQVTV